MKLIFKLEILDKENRFLFCFLIDIFRRLFILSIVMLIGWGFLEIGLIEELWGLYFYIAFVLSAFALGRDYQRQKMFYFK